MRPAYAAAVLLVAVASAGAAARAQALVDPMRPAEYVAPGAAGATSGPVLQQIYVSPERRYAVIDGTRVSPGERYGDARVVRISETEVALQSERGTTVLTMHPEVQKRTRSGAPADRPQKGTRE